MDRGWLVWWFSELCMCGGDEDPTQPNNEQENLFQSEQSKNTKSATKSRNVCNKINFGYLGQRPRSLYLLFFLFVVLVILMH